MASVFGNDNSNVIGIFWWDGVTEGNDFIDGRGGNDTIYGRGGDDTIKGGGGADYINGGAGTDTASYMDSTTGVTVNLEQGRGYGGSAEGDTLVSIESVIGSYHDDSLIGNNGANTLIGGDGNDLLKGGGGADRLSGDAGNDTLKGGGGADVLNGGAGIDEASYYDSAAGVSISLITDAANGGDATGDDLNSIENVTGSNHADTLIGDNGANVLRGLSGNDTLKGYGGDDTLVGDAGDDQLFGMDGNDTLRGGDGNDRLDGGTGNDRLEGGAGNDTMIGGTGNDTMIGGAGDDRYYVDAAGDVVTEAAGQGNDVVFSSALGYTLSANVETLSLDTDTDTGVYGTGNAQANVIYGNANHNVLEGGGGADFLNGLGGNDNFVFRPGDANGDTVHDFQGNGVGVGDFMYFIGYGTAAQGASFVQLSANTWQINSANGLTHDVVTFSGTTSIDAADFVFI